MASDPTEHTAADRLTTPRPAPGPNVGADAPLPGSAIMGREHTDATAAAAASNSPRLTRENKRALGRTTIYVTLAAASVIMLIPFLYLTAIAFRAPGAEGMFLPSGDGALGVDWSGGFTLANFVKIFTKLPFLTFIANSFFLASWTALLATFCAAAGGYALAKFKFFGRDAVMNLILGAIVIPGALLIAPAYQLLYWLGLLDTYAGLILPGVAPAFGIYLFRQASLAGVPDEILESARIDGCGEFRIFFQMVLPLLRPMIGAFLLITFLAQWNNYIGPQIVLQSEDKFPLAVGIQRLRGLYGSDFGAIMAGTLVSILPVLVLFLMLQKEFIAGLTSGAVKG